MYHQYPNMLKVSGKLDFKAGGKVDWEKARNAVDTMELPDFILKAGRQMVDYFSQEYPDGLDPMILEIKSISAFMFDLYERSGKSSRNHRLQLVHYLKSSGIEKGLVVYICKDDCRMLEVPVLCPSPVESDYYKEIKELTEYYNSGELPPKEKAIVYDEDTEKFTKNWHVAYSNYLTKLYGFKSQKEFDDRYSSIPERWNRVLGRLREGKKVTDKNADVIEEIKQAGWGKVIEDIEKI
jgi:hypothetical protein